MYRWQWATPATVPVGVVEGGQLAELCISSFYSLSSPSQTTLTRRGRGGKWYWKQDFFATVKKYPNVNMVILKYLGRWSIIWST